MKEVWLCNFKSGHCKKKSNDDHFLISPPKIKICNTHIIVSERWLCVLPQCKALVLAVHSRETRNDSNETRRVSTETRRVSRETRRVSRETRRVSRETRRVSREGGNLHLSGTVHQQVVYGVHQQPHRKSRRFTISSSDITQGFSGVLLGSSLSCASVKEGAASECSTISD